MVMLITATTITTTVTAATLASSFPTAVTTATLAADIAKIEDHAKITQSISDFLSGNWVKKPTKNMKIG